MGYACFWDWELGFDGHYGMDQQCWGLRGLNEDPWQMNEAQWTSPAGVSTILQSWDDWHSNDEHWEFGGPSIRRAAVLREKRLQAKKVEKEVCPWGGRHRNRSRRIRSRGRGRG